MVLLRGDDFQEGSVAASDPHCFSDFGTLMPDLSTVAPWEEKKNLLQEGSFALPVAEEFV